MSDAGRETRVGTGFPRSWKRKLGLRPSGAENSGKGVDLSEPDPTVRDFGRGIDQLIERIRNERFSIFEPGELVAQTSDQFTSIHLVGDDMYYHKDGKPIRKTVTGVEEFVKKVETGWQVLEINDQRNR